MMTLLPPMNAAGTRAARAPAASLILDHIRRVSHRMLSVECWALNVQAVGKSLDRLHTLSTA